MSRFLLQRKLMTFADRYSIRDEQGEDAYLARGQWMSIGKKIHVKDREGKEVALLQRKLGTLRPQFVITIPGLPNGWPTRISTPWKCWMTGTIFRCC